MGEFRVHFCLTLCQFLFDKLQVCCERAFSNYKYRCSLELSGLLLFRFVQKAFFVLYASSCLKFATWLFDE